MKNIVNLEQANEILAGYVAKDMVGAYKLERMKSLMELLGNPQDNLRVIHVAGTSGKTSTVYYSAALLQAAGKKVGFSVSPHVSEVNERLQIDGNPINEAEFCHVLSEFLDLISGFPIKPTYFELLVAMAYWEFARRKVDYAVMEVGLGGLLDGTNVVNRQDKICVITDIGLDHINILGDNLTDIAKQKAGIIHLGNEVFAYSQNDEVDKVFRGTCEKQNANIHLLTQQVDPGLSFLPLFQQRNLSLAKEAVDFALERDFDQKLSRDNLLTAAKITIPARMESHEKNGKVIIFDGAHNYQKLNALGKSIKAMYPGKSVAALVSFADGRGYRLEGSIKALREITPKVIYTSFVHHQDLPHGSVDPEVLADMSKGDNFEEIQTEKSATKAFNMLMTQNEDILLVTGSFFIMNELRPLAKL